MVDHARERQSLKRGGGALKVTLDEAALVTETRAQELLDLDEALERLAAQDARKSQIVELRYFDGLTDEETAEFLNARDDQHPRRRQPDRRDRHRVVAFDHVLGDVDTDL